MKRLDSLNASPCSDAEDESAGGAATLQLDPLECVAAGNLPGMLSGLKTEALQLALALSNAEANYVVACTSVDTLLDAVQAAIMLAQDHLKADDMPGQDALRTMMACAERLLHASRHFQRQSRSLAAVGGILRLILQSLANVKNLDAAAPPLEVKPSGRSGGKPLDIASRLSKLRLDGEQVALQRNSPALARVSDCLRQLQEVMEMIVRPAADDFLEIEHWLGEIRKQDEFIKLRLREGQ